MDRFPSIYPLVDLRKGIRISRLFASDLLELGFVLLNFVVKSVNLDSDSVENFSRLDVFLSSGG